MIFDLGLDFEDENSPYLYVFSISQGSAGRAQGFARRVTVINNFCNIKVIGIIASYLPTYLPCVA